MGYSLQGRKDGHDQATEHAHMLCLKCLCPAIAIGDHQGTNLKRKARRMKWTSVLLCLDLPDL